MTDRSRLRQAGRAGGVDQQRTIVDRNAASLGRRQVGGVHGAERQADFGPVTMEPAARRINGMRARCVIRIGELLGDDGMNGRGDI
jgi:hypothetical protein